MKKNLKEEITRNRKLMGLPINEDLTGQLKTLWDLIYTDDLKNKVGAAYDVVKSKFPNLGLDKDEKSTEEKPEKKDEEEPEVDINTLEKDSEEEKEFLEKIHKSLNIRDISSNSNCGCKTTRLENTKYFITHHTGGNGDCNRVMGTLNSRGLGVQWIVDREGNVCQSLPLNSVGFHILDSQKGPTNYNSQGVEVSAKDDSDILPIQAVSVLKLIKKLGIKPSQVYGHGEVNPGHKQASEGQTIKKFIEMNYNRDEDDYVYTMFGDDAPDFN